MKKLVSLVIGKYRKFRRIFYYLCYKAGVRPTIPGKVINRVPVSENNEPLVDIKNIEKEAKARLFFFGGRLEQETQVFLRNSAAERLVNAAKSLPEGVFLLVYDAFRSLETQQKLWERKYKEMKERYPNEPEDIIVKKTKAFAADPRFGYGGHQTGGAVDVALCDENGRQLNMGTAYSEDDTTKTPTNKAPNPESRKNRELLLDAMCGQGFVNYPNEWWHFCYGDRMWAAYLNKSECFYGMRKEAEAK